MLKNVKIAHISSDSKFLDYAYNLFEQVAAGCSDYYVFSATNSIKYIKKTPFTKISRIAYKNPFFCNILREYDFIVLHSLNDFSKQLVLHTAPDIKYVWIGWGFDYYDLIYNEEDKLYLEKTRKIAKDFAEKSKLKMLAKIILNENSRKLKAIKRINYFSPVLKHEYEQLIQKYKTDLPTYISWTYGLNLDLKEGPLSKKISLNGYDILLGNNASLTNNHLEIFDKLSLFKPRGVKIICPLSYGNLKYANFIESRGIETFGDDFKALKKFLPYKDYINEIRSCSNIIMNHVRQQGAGNLAAMLFLGAKIYLNRNNPLYKHYINRGLKVFTIDELEQKPEMLSSDLSPEDILNNKNILKKSNTYEDLINKTHNLIKELLK